MQPLVGILMGSASDWETMQGAATTLTKLGVPHEVRVISAHRTPDLLFEYAASARDRGLEVIIAGAGGAAALPGCAAAKTSLPVLGVPIHTKTLSGLDSLLSIAQMPAGIPVGTLAIGAAGAANAALLAAAILANKHPAVGVALEQYRRAQTSAVLATTFACPVRPKASKRWTVPIRFAAKAGAASSCAGFLGTRAARCSVA
jgi:5-(carboxyamino)imidazole ribonucleotide mutase